MKPALCLSNKQILFRLLNLFCNILADTGLRSLVCLQKIDSSHEVINLGHLWSCSRCKASYSVRTPAKGRLAKKCQGKATKKEQTTNAGVDATKTGFAALFFRDKREQGARGSQPRSESPSQVPSAQHGSPIGDTFPSHTQAQNREVGEKMLSSAGLLSCDPQPVSTEATSARVPQPVGKESTAHSSEVSGGKRKSSVTKPKPKAKMTKDTSSTPSVLQFIRKQ